MDILALIERETPQFETRWEALSARITAQFGKSMSVEGILFMIGVQESGKGFKRRLEKEQKQDLILEGTFQVLSALGIYEQTDLEWKLVTNLPKMPQQSQEMLVQLGILAYLGDL